MQHTLRSALFVATVVSGAVGFSSSVAACGTDSYLGTICTFAFDYCPQGTLPANGQILSINSNNALFALLGNRYGGDGKTNFALPDLRGRGTIGTGTGVGFTQAINIGQKVGQQSIVLNSAQVPLPAHSHTATFTGTGGGGTGPLKASGTVSLPLSGSVKDVPISGTMGTSAVTGTISAKALSAATSGGVNVPSATNNTVGRVSGGSTTFYAPSTSDVVVPTTFDLQASGGTLTATGTGGTLTGTATGNVSLAVTGATGITGGTVTVGATALPAAQAVPAYSPSMGQTVCIVVEGLYPSRPY